MHVNLCVCVYIGDQRGELRAAGWAHDSRWSVSIIARSEGAPVYIYTYNTYICVHIYTYTYTYIYIYIHIDSLLLCQKIACTHRIHTRGNRLNVHIVRTYTDTHTQTHIHRHTHTSHLSLSHAHTHAYMHTHTHTFTHTHTHMHTHTHTQTHTYTYACTPQIHSGTQKSRCYYARRLRA